VDQISVISSSLFTTFNKFETGLKTETALKSNKEFMFIIVFKLSF